MRTLFSIKTLLVLFVAGTFIAYAGEPLQNATVVLKSPDGKTFKTTTDASGKFEFRDIDDDCDGYSISVKSGKSVFMTGSSNKVSVHDISMSSKVRESPTTSSLRESPSKISDKNKTKRDAASGLATGKRQHSPFTFKTTLCPKGTEDCDDKSLDVCVIELSSDGGSIQGMAINEKGLPGDKKPVKANK